MTRFLSDLASELDESSIFWLCILGLFAWTVIRVTPHIVNGVVKIYEIRSKYRFKREELAEKIRARQDRKAKPRPGKGERK